MSENKTLQKSIRMREDIYEFIMSQPEGKGLNSKFEILVEIFRDDLPRLQAEKAMIVNDIVHAKETLRFLNNQIRSIESVGEDAKRLREKIDYLLEM